MEMNETSWDQIQEFKSKNFKESALAQLNGRWGMSVLLTLVTTAIVCVLIGIVFPWEYYISAITSAIQGYGEPDISAFPIVRYCIGLLLVVIIAPVIDVAYYYAFTVLYKTKEPLKFSDFVTGFSLWGKAMGAFWWQYLWLMLWALLATVPGFIITIIAAIAESNGGIIFGLIVLYFCLYAVMIVKAYQYSQTEFAIADNNEVKVTQALNISKAITKGYKWKLFCLDFSFIGWGILAAMFPIGNLWLTPYMTAAKFSAYRYLLKAYNDKAGGAEPAAIEQKPLPIEEENVVPEVDTTDTNNV